MANNCGCKTMRSAYPSAARTYEREKAAVQSEAYCGCALMQKLMTADFYLQDLKLYLDTHPCDEKALCLYRKTAKLVREYRETFENENFPLVETSAGQCEHTWDWLEGSWPPARL